ncbi:MAG: ABC transporter permease [Myxococcaceae bacterium]
MSLRSSIKSLPTLMKVGFAEAVAYRAEMIVWVLATTMPLVMYQLWSAVSRVAPIGGYGKKDFLAYFLAAFIVRQLTGSWAAWQMNFEVRQGTLAMKLLRPLHPLLTYATENLSYLPMRLVIVAPVLTAMVILVGPGYLPHTPLQVVIWFFGTVGGWGVIFLINLCIGCMALFIKSTLKFMDAYLAMSFVFSGYLIPVELFPDRLRHLIDWLPFRYTIGLPIELFVTRHSDAEALSLLARQWCWVAILFVTATLLWRRGISKFEAYGG